MDRKAALVAFNTILRKEIIRFFRIWAQTLVPPAVTTLLYFLVFGNFIGSRVGTVGGYDYVTFIVPGLVMMAVINNAYTNVVSSFFSAKFQKHVEELLVSPCPNSVILAGFVAAGVVRGILTGLIVTAVAMAFTPVPLKHPLVTVTVVLLASVLFSLGGFVNAMLARKFDDISIFPTFVLTPLTYLGGVFYSIEMLPQPWRAISTLNPILYIVNGFRYGLLGTSDIPPAVAYALLLLFIAATAAVALRLLDKGVGLRN